MFDIGAEHLLQRMHFEYAQSPFLTLLVDIGMCRKTVNNHTHIKKLNFYETSSSRGLTYFYRNITYH